jgi:hypothetical protein
VWSVAFATVLKQPEPIMTVTYTVEGTRGTASGSATATRGPRRTRREPAFIERITVALDSSGRTFPAHSFALADYSDGKAEAIKAALALFRQVSEQAGPPAQHLDLRDFIAHAGAAQLSGFPVGGESRSRAWAGYAVMNMVADLMVFALKQVDLGRFEREVLERLAHEQTWSARRDAEEKAAFVSRMAEGRRRAAERRAQGGAA